MTGSVSVLEKSLVKLLTVDVIRCGNLHDHVFDCLHRCLRVAVRLGVLWQRYHMLSSPTVEETCELSAHKLGSSIGPEMYRDAHIAEVVTKLPYGRGSSSVTNT